MTRAASRTTRTAELTLEEYLATPVTTRRQEVIDGVIRMCPAPTLEHQDAIGNSYTELKALIHGRDLGHVYVAPFDLLIQEKPKLRTRQPDVAVFLATRISAVELKKLKICSIAPDLVVEARSESETPARWADKLADYASIGVPEVWRVLLADKAVEVLFLNEGRYEQIGRYAEDEAVRSRVIPDLILPVGRIFA